jgi:hypothetical protein
VAKPLSKADSIVNAAIQAHGGKRYTADYLFEFRGKNIAFKIMEISIYFRDPTGDSLLRIYQS